MLSIVDASNLERNLYLVSQVLELGLPTVVALNMGDVARSKGLSIDVERLQEPAWRAGRRSAGQSPRRHGGVEAGAGRSGRQHRRRCARKPVPGDFNRKRGPAIGLVRVPRAKQCETADPPLPRYLVERLLLDTSGYLQDTLARQTHRHCARGEILHAARQRLAAAGLHGAGRRGQVRYAWVARVLDGVVTRPATSVETRRRPHRSVLTHKVWGTVVFALMMLVVFSSVFIVADPLMGCIDEAIGAVGAVAAEAAAPGPAASRWWSTA